MLLGSIYAGVWSWVPFLFEWWFGERVVRLPPFALLRAVNDSFTAGSTLLPAWIVGGACGLVGAASAVARERQGPLRKEAPALLVLVVLAVVGAEAVADPSSGFRLRTFTFVKWQPGPSPTIIDDEHNWLSPQEVARLKALNLGGRLKTEGLSIDQGIGLRSYVVIVMQHQVKEPVRLPLTTSRYTIYLQDQNGWHLLPPQPRPGRYAIRLEPWMTSAGDLTGIWVETPSGTGGSTAFNWSPEAP